MKNKDKENIDELLLKTSLRPWDPITKDARNASIKAANIILFLESSHGGKNRLAINKIT